jgi:hypothetical protein
LGTWPRFWALVIGLGVVGGAFQWWVGGWWCKVRLRWSGAAAPDPRLARLLLIYSSFVFAGPAVVSALLQTAVYPSYLVAYEKDVILALLVMATVFWSVATTYKGALAMFPVQKARARLWFMILPVLFLFIVMGGAAVLFAAAG